MINTELPRYRCHKVVEALKITAIEFAKDGSARIAPGTTHPLVYTTKPGYRERFKFAGGDDLGYYVRYDDGYESWSPTKAFEEDYTRIEGRAVAEVHTLPGVLRADLEKDVPPAQCLASVAALPLRSVAIVGRTIAGEIVVFGSSPDADAAIGLLERGKLWLANAKQVQHKEGED